MTTVQWVGSATANQFYADGKSSAVLVIVGARVPDQQDVIPKTRLPTWWPVAFGYHGPEKISTCSTALTICCFGRPRRDYDLLCSLFLKHHIEEGLFRYLWLFGSRCSLVRWNVIDMTVYR
jgi:hypothetical protein